MALKLTLLVELFLRHNPTWNSNPRYVKQIAGGELLWKMKMRHPSVSPLHLLIMLQALIHMKSDVLKNAI